MAKPRAPSSAIPIAEPARVESSTSGANAPTLAELIEAGAADANVEAGYIRHRTEESFAYWLRQAERTWYAYEAHGLRGRRSPVSNGKTFEEFAHKIGISYDVAMVLFDLHPLKARVLAKIETDKEIADNKGKPYKYPTWRTALKWFKPKPEQEPFADDKSETPVADDLAARNFTLQQELKAVRDHEFELTGRIKELEAENAELRKAKPPPLSAEWKLNVIQRMTREHEADPASTVSRIIQLIGDPLPEPQNDIGADGSLGVSEPPPDASQTDLDSVPPGTPESISKAPVNDLDDPPVTDVSTKPAQAKKAGRKAKKFTAVDEPDPKRNPEADRPTSEAIPNLFEPLEADDGSVLSWVSVEKEAHETQAEYDARLKAGWKSGAFKTQEAVDAARAAPSFMPEVA